MKQRELNKKVQLLKAGQVVQIAGDFFRAIKFDYCDPMDVCAQCDLDSICQGDVSRVCSEMDSYGSRHWVLKLAHPV